MFLLYVCATVDAIVVVVEDFIEKEHQLCTDVSIIDSVRTDFNGQASFMDESAAVTIHVVSKIAYLFQQNYIRKHFPCQNKA